MNLKHKIKDRQKAQVSLDKLQGYAIAFVVIGVVLTVGLQVLTGVGDEIYEEVDVENELETPSNLAAEVTVDEVGEGLVTNTETIKWYDASDSSNTTLDQESDYEVVSYENGTFEVLDNFDYDETDGDELYFDYTSKDSDSEANKGADAAVEGLSTFTDWLPIIAIVMVSAIIIGLVMRFNGRSKGTKGRA